MLLAPAGVGKTAMVVALDDPPCQPRPAKGGWDQGWWPSGIVCFDGVDHDCALLLGLTPRRPGGGQTPRLACFSCDAISDGQSDARKA